MVFKSKAKDTAGKASAGTAARPARPAAAAVSAADIADVTGADTDEDQGEDVLGESKPGKKVKEEEHEYEILEPGTIIGDLHFPLTGKDVKKGEEMIVKLAHSVAQNHQLRGVRLRRHVRE